MRRIAFVLTSHFQIVDLAAAAAFTLANSLTGREHYAVTFLSEHGGLVGAGLGLHMQTQALDQALIGPAPDTLFLMGPARPRTSTPAQITLLRAIARLSRRVAASSGAAFQLAETGLLDGRRATTHWACADDLRRSFPAVRVDADTIYTNDGPYWTSAGMTATCDLALALIEQDLGQALSREIAKQMVLHYRRQGGEAQISPLLHLEPATDRIRRVLGHIHRNLGRDLSVEELAEIAHLSPRQFSRLFRQETGQSPAKAVESLRLETARRLLRDSALSLDAVAREAGFSDRDRMCRAFMRNGGQPPSVLREERTRPQAGAAHSLVA